MQTNIKQNGTAMLNMSNHTNGLDKLPPNFNNRCNTGAQTFFYSMREGVKVESVCTMKQNQPKMGFVGDAQFPG